MTLVISILNFYRVRQQSTMARRRQYTVPQKLAILQDFARLQDEGGHSLRAAARSLEVDASQLRRWRREAESFNQFIAPPGNQN